MVVTVRIFRKFAIWNGVSIFCTTDFGHVYDLRKFAKDKKYSFSKKTHTHTIFEELCQNGWYSENIQKKCYLERGITFLYDRFLLCL